MSNEQSAKRAIILAIALPILMIIITALIVFIPRSGTQPQYDFLYTVDRYYYQNYTIEEGVLELEKRELTLPATEKQKEQYEKVPTLYRYDVQTDTSEVVTLEQTQTWTLDRAKDSPDEFHIEYGRGGGFFPFGFSGGNYRDRYLVGHYTSRELNLEQSTDGYAYSFQFLGWIISE